jgi:membrane-associated protease RseP (regulator of RpoE activity)
MNARKLLLVLLGLVVVGASMVGMSANAKAQAPGVFPPIPPQVSFPPPVPLPQPVPFPTPVPVAPRVLGVSVVSTNGGLQVNAVLPNSPAAFAGIRPGDVIIRVANWPVYYPTDIRRHLDLYLAQNPNGSVPIVLLTWQYDPNFGWRRVYRSTSAPFNATGVFQIYPPVSR